VVAVTADRVVRPAAMVGVAAATTVVLTAEVEMVLVVMAAREAWEV
jgi:hypothetical protein